MTATAPTVAPAPVLTQRRILWFWLPLAASWLLMGSEMPIINAALARLPAAETMIAAFGIVGSLSITIESPVIMLLATSTALARTRQNYLRLRQFTLHLMLATTLVHVLVGWTPLFDVVVRGWMQVPDSLVEPVRLGMRLMVVWSAAIAWRRFTQGLLIRYGQTRFVGQGTVVRLLASAGLAVSLAILTPMSGIAVATLALSLGVIVEAVYAHAVARPLVARRFGPNAPHSGDPDLGYMGLVRFHTPLAASTFLFLLSQPMVTAALARLPNPETVLAAWPVAAGLLFMTRAPALALPEVVIALIDENGSRPALRRFCQRVGLAGMLVLALLSFTPLAHFYFRTLLGVHEQLASLAATGTQVGVTLPLIIAVQSWFRGVLTARRATLPLTLAMLVNLGSMALVLAGGVILRAPGVALAGAALTVATLSETATLWVAQRRISDEPGV
jgi:progressive ankylosis protein